MSEIKPIAKIYTQFPSKFGIPRQSGLADTEGMIVFEKEFRCAEAVRGIEGFSHLWLIWEFSEAKSSRWSPTVRPPRLGGNKRMGVFATRSPFRPNFLGLSSVELERVDMSLPDAPVLFVRGADILDKTPVFDIKPYLPFTDSHPQAAGGFAAAEEKNNLAVRFETEIPPEFCSLLPTLQSLLENDPRPHYQNDAGRVYSFEFAGYNIKFSCDGDAAVVSSIKKL